MSSNRQFRRDAEGRPLPDPDHTVVGYPRTYPDGHVIARHHHDHGQVLYAISGLMRVATAHGNWVVPPQRAVWIPAGMAHEVAIVGEVEMRSLYVLKGLHGLPPDCRVMHVSPLLRELIATFAAMPGPYPPDGPEARLVGVILDQLRGAREATPHLPMPGSPRLRPIVRGLLADPGDRRGLAEWAREVGASTRTLARLFEAETGMGFRAWRRQVRLHEALARLAAGEAVTSVAFAVGYDSPSAFIYMFRRALGATPQRYFGRRARLPGPRGAA